MHRLVVALIIPAVLFAFGCGRLRGRPPGPGACTTMAPDSGVAPRAFRPDGGTGDKTAVIKDRAILLSLDGMGAVYVQKQLAAGKLPGLARLRTLGATTLNARADYDYTVTLPNHTSMLTGRPVWTDDALPNTAYHGWTINSDVGPTVTLHNAGNPNLPYIASVFDVVHDHGYSTCLYSGKTKFSVFANSYGPKFGAPDRVGEDDGCNKIDRVAIIENTDLLVSTVEADLTAGACDFAFVHIADLDWQGHSIGWGSNEWLSALDRVDEWIRRIGNLADASLTANPYLLVLTADHGGINYSHSDASLPADYTIPFFLFGPGIPAGVDLYALAGPGRADPGDLRPRYSAAVQPVRNADAANVVTDHLGLPPVPGSFMRGLIPAH